MGNSSSKDSRSQPRQGDAPHASSPITATRPPPGAVPPPPSSDRVTTQVYSGRPGGRGSRGDLSFLSLGREREAQPTPERPRETKQEREARKAEKERQARVKERERSMREEGVDGGYLVTLGVYTGAEDFNKGVVRQLQIERRLAPFWKGLDDHSRSWTEAQLVAAAQGLPIPAADEVPPPMARTGSQASASPRASDNNLNSLTVPISSRSQSYESSTSAHLSASHPAFSHSGAGSPPTSSPSTAQLFRGRAKTLASLATGSKSSSPDLTPQEVRLTKDPYVNGQPIEAYLYKDASECPICFMYYPPHLNKTRCCDQPICSECFVQIKRPDPHPPEHDQPGQERPPEEEAEQLVSEVAACPFCVTPEFGVSYDPPPFRRGLAYANQRNPLSNPTSAMSSSTSLAGGNRRRATSLSANSPQVITTDRVRPDWAKKLADARAHALRRSAAATALHNAAYVLGNQTEISSRGGLPTLGRRRRTLMFESPSGSGTATPGSADRLMISPYGHVLRRRGESGGEDGSGDLYPDRGSSRRTRVEDLEDLMMMEAIRLSLAAEEDRKKREDKDAKKDAKKRAKEEKKEAKAAEKAAKKAAGGSGSQLYHSGTNDSASTWASTSMARSTSNLGMQPQQSIPEEQVQGKGKAPAQPEREFGFNPLSDPSSTLNTEMQDQHHDLSGNGAESAQRHLEESRAHLQPSSSTPIPVPSRFESHQRQISNASSAASSFGGDSSAFPSNLPSARGSGVDLTAGAHDTSDAASGTPPAGTSNLEPMLNFRSLAAVIGEEDKAGHGGSEHIENTGNTSDQQNSTKAEEQLKEPSPRLSPEGSAEGNRSRGDSGESSNSAPPPIYVESPPPATHGDGDEITPAPARTRIVHDVDAKDINRVDVVDHGHVGHEATQ